MLQTRTGAAPFLWRRAAPKRTLTHPAPMPTTCCVRSAAVPPRARPLPRASRRQPLLPVRRASESDDPVKTTTDELAESERIKADRYARLEVERTPWWAQRASHSVWRWAFRLGCRRGVGGVATTGLRLTGHTGSSPSPHTSAPNEYDFTEVQRLADGGEMREGQMTAIITGVLSLAMGFGYIAVVSALDGRGTMLEPPPPEALGL